MAHFYGTANESHYETEYKKLSPLGKAEIILFVLLVIGAIVAGLFGKWNIMIITIGIICIFVDVMVRTIFHTKNKVLLIFVFLGILALLVGILWCIGGTGWGIISALAMPAVIWFMVGIICTVCAIKMISKRKKCSLEVTADCEMGDVRRLNLFRFDDINDNGSINSNRDTLFKPMFHYFVDGQEYFVLSNVYYGDLNTGFKEGSKVKLYVNPNNPTELQPQNSGSASLLVMGIIGLLAGIIFSVAYVVLFLLGMFTQFLYL